MPASHWQLKTCQFVRVTGLENDNCERLSVLGAECNAGVWGSSVVALVLLRGAHHVRQVCCVALIAKSGKGSSCGGLRGMQRAVRQALKYACANDQVRLGTQG